MFICREIKQKLAVLKQLLETFEKVRVISFINNSPQFAKVLVVLAASFMCNAAFRVFRLRVSSFRIGAGIITASYSKWEVIRDRILSF